MAKIKYIDDRTIGKKNTEKIKQVNIILAEYGLKGYRLTLRQLYYQMVSRDIIPNNQLEYNKLSGALKHGRMTGLVDWGIIEDRTRAPQTPYSNTDPKEAIESLLRYYRIDRQLDQDNYMELWCEKDAISNILYQKTAKYHIPLMVNRGYSSCTAMYEAANRFRRAIKRGQKPHIMYCGDHDPSGLDMAQRDIAERLLDFKVAVNVDHIALTTEQVKLYDPPTNPAKISDPRAAWYIGKFGKSSWEVDALTPEIFHSTIEEKITALIDMEKYEERLEQERLDKDLLQEQSEYKDRIEELHSETFQQMREAKNDLSNLDKNKNIKALEKKQITISAKARIESHQWQLDTMESMFKFL